MIPDWINIFAPVAAALSGVIVAGGVNHWLAIRRERRQLHQETEGAAIMLLAEVDRINYRLGMAFQQKIPESPKRDFNKAFYHSLQPRIGLAFRPQTIEALVTFYQSVERLESLADAYNHDLTPRTLDQWKSEVQMAHLRYCPLVVNALGEERSSTRDPRAEAGPREG